MKKESKKLFPILRRALDYFIADLSVRSEVTRVADEIKAKWSIIDGLFNNAGVLTSVEKKSAQGVELQFEVNTIAPYSLSLNLIDALRRAKNPFIVNTVTRKLNAESDLNIEELKRPTKFIKLTGSYFYSKLALALIMKYLSSVHPNIRILNVDPGGNRTNMAKSDAVPLLIKPLASLFFSHPRKGAEKLFDAAFSDKNIKSGAYITEGKIKEINFSISDEEVEEMLRTEE